jgi:hypothetical protein
MSDLNDTDEGYLKEVLGHPASVSGLLGAITAGALLSLVGGLGPAAIPLLMWGGAEALAALFLPGSPVFREWVDRKRRAERREARRSDLNARIQKKVSALQTEARVGRRGAGPLLDELEDYGTQYARMRERLAAMTRMVNTGQVSVHSTELEKLDDATVDFLRLAWARIVMFERLEDHDERDLARQVKELEHQLSQAATPVEERKLKQAITELNRVMERRRLLPAQDAATRAQLMGMVDAFEELYHHLNTEGGGAEVARYLREATERLHVEEELQASVEVEMEDIARKAAGRRRAAE